MEENKVEVTSENKISTKEKSAYAIGSMNDLIMNNVLNTLISPVYNIALGVTPDLTGYAAAIPRAWDAISDPIVAGLSDNFRSKWGRRKPFMVLGAIISSLSFMAIWFVPTSWGSIAMVIYLILLSLIFYTGNTLFLVPYNGFGYALSNDYNERTSLFAYKATVGAVGGFLLPWSYWFITLPIFSGSIQGAKILSIIVALAIIASCLVPVLFCKERYDEQIVKQEKVPIITGIKETLSHRPFLLLISSVSIMFMSMYTIGGIGFFLNISYVFPNSETGVALVTGIGGTLWKVSSLISIPFIFFLSKRIGKKLPYIFSMLLACLAAASAWFTVTPQYPYLQLVVQFFMGPGITCVLMLSDSMLADICDLDELKTNKRREAMFGAIYGWFVKVGVTGAMALSGVLVVWTGFQSSLPVQSESTIFWMRLLMTLIPGIGMLVSILLMSFYSLTSSRVNEIKMELEKRHQEEI